MRIDTLKRHMRMAGRSQRYPDRLFTWDGDADLDPRGSWWVDDVMEGVENLKEGQPERVVAVLKGHKVFADRSQQFELSEEDQAAVSQQACETICDAVIDTGYVLDSDSDGWYLNVEVRVVAPWKYRPDGRVNFPATCRAVLTLAKQAADTHGQAWQEIDTALEAQYAGLENTEAGRAGAEGT